MYCAGLNRFKGSESEDQFATADEGFVIFERGQTYPPLPTRKGWGRSNFVQSSKRPFKNKKSTQADSLGG